MLIKFEVLRLVTSKNQQKQSPEKETLPITGQTLPGITASQYMATSQLLKLSSAVLITKDY